jgi:tRNA(Ile2)-agmatinylcytidine synthase
MKSKGLTAGYVCEKCGEVSPPSAAILVEVDRGIQLGVYEVPCRSRRHLSKPFGLARVYYSYRSIDIS